MSSLIWNRPSGLTDEGRPVFFVCKELITDEPDANVRISYETDS